jgi:hypothetical protein
MAFVRDFSRFVVVTLLFACIPVVGYAQPFAEQNVNMVSGQGWPGGDPFLRQQNEPSMAVSTRNPLHLLAGANDYRSVDIPFSAPARPDDEETGDAWLGVFRSKDGGNTWSSTLLDGYPQLTNTTSPLHGFQAAADPVVRAGNNGMFYYAGIVLNRGNNPLGGVFVARFIDNNNTETGDPVAYLDTKLIDQGTAGQFIDKPWFAVAPMTNGGQCTVNGQMFAAQNLYLAYSVFVGNDNNIRTKIMFTRSTDCGATWAGPQKLSESLAINQGVNIAVDPTSGAVYAAWRRFHGGNDPDSIIIAKSTNGGATFTKGSVVTNITPFEQGTSAAAVRTNAYAAMAVDGTGRVYIAWSQRDALTNDGRLVLINSADGLTGWSSPLPVAPPQAGTSNGRGHQFMPAMTFSSGRLTLVWYDLRDDHTIAGFTKHTPFNGTYDQSRLLAGNLFLNQPQVVFWNYLADVSPTLNSPKLVRRHTLDVYAAESIGLGLTPSFSNSARVTRYKFGALPPTYTTIQDLQINPPNLPMFRQGTVPFFGDYIDLATYAATPTSARVRHVVWTDNRDVRAPLGNPPDWTKYTPVHSPSLGNTSIFDPTQHPPDCVVDNPISNNAVSAGSRNQNIYTTRVTDGLFAGSPGNAKPVNGTITHAFTVFVQNTRGTLTSYHLAIVQSNIASFLQFASLPALDVNIPPHSTATRTVFVTAPAHTRVDVNITENGGPLSTVVSLNPDPTNPDIGNPDIGNNEVFNPDIGNPDIGNPDIGNPAIGNPDIGNPDIGNPDIGNPDIGNPDIGNPDIGNPDIGNPDIGNPDIGNGSVTDTTWTAHNQGNTTGGYTVKLFKNGDLPPGVTTAQLILSKVYDTPVARGCDLAVEHNKQVIVSITDPTFALINQLSDPSLNDPSEKNATLWLAPGDAGRITVRLIDPDPTHKNRILDASTVITPVIIAHSVNSADFGFEGATPASAGPPLVITTASLPRGMTGEYYSQTFKATGGVPPYAWTVEKGPLPAQLSLTADGFLSGGLSTAADSFLTFRATDSNNHFATKTFLLHVVDPLLIQQQLADAVTGQAYSTTLQATGGFGTRSWTMTAPDGVTLTSAGLFSAPSGFSPSGTRTFTVRVTDTDSPPQVVNGDVTVRVVDPLLITTTSFPNAVQGFFYSTDLASTGGTAPIHWSVVTSVPDEMTLSDSGTISGISSFTETPVVVVRATDSSNPAQVVTSQQIPLVVYSAGCGAAQVSELYTNSNTQTVFNGGQSPTFDTKGQTYCLSSMVTYHWNGGAGAKPGHLGLIFTATGRRVDDGSWIAVGSSGQGGAPNVNWTAGTGRQVIVLNGNYTVTDSDLATWSQNAASNGFGFVHVLVTPASNPFN